MNNTRSNFVVRRWRRACWVGGETFAATFAMLALICIIASPAFGRELVPVQIGLGLSLLVAAPVGVLGGFGAYRLDLEDERRRTGRCPRCGYDLRESTGRCPECGARFSRRARGERTAKSASSGPPG